MYKITEMLMAFIRAFQYAIIPLNEVFDQKIS